jgi:predicted transcriptional regulator
LKRNEIISIALIAIVLSFSYLAIAYPQCNNINFATIQDADDTQRLIFSTPLVIGASLHENSRLLNQPTRMKIYSLVKDNPGIHFRAICNRLNLPIGAAQYHLNLLITAGLISVYTDGMYKRYFESKTFAEADMKIISLLRHNTIKSILSLLSQSGSMAHKEIASKIGVSSQALTWQINRLKKNGLIDITKEGMKVKYSLNQEKATTIKRYLIFV